MSPHFQVCTKCVLDTSDPQIVFDESGVCNYCHKYASVFSKIVKVDEAGRLELARKIDVIKGSRSASGYDCIIGISGGVDSTYVALLAKRYGLRALAVHFDSGWNSELAVKNIENIVDKLQLDLVTVVCDWEEMKDLQRSFLLASVPNADIPQDHGFYAALYSTAIKYGIRHIISGHNVQTEAILPPSWGFDSQDLVHLKAIQKQFGKVKLKKYPMLGMTKKFLARHFRSIETFRILHYQDYKYEKAKAEIIREVSWKDYGGKHYESIWTRFFQGYYLPVKFKIDKRKAHLSNLICSGQLTRQEAVEKLQEPRYPHDLLRQDIEFVQKKLSFSKDEFDVIMNAEPRRHQDYPTFRSRYPLLAALKDKL